jgi:hypothetical protein
MFFDAFGRFALGQITAPGGNGQGNLKQAAGIGVAGVIPPHVDRGITQAGGTGVAGAFAISNVALVIGASGVGIAGSLNGEVDAALTGVSGIGLAGSITLRYVNFAGAAGTGVAGILFESEQAFLLGVSGSGIVGPITANPQAFLFGSAVGVGVAGQIISPIIGGQPVQPAGVGVAGQITVTISGGGTSRKPNTGLEPVKKRPPRPIKPFKAKVVLPPSLDISPPLAPAETSPIDHIEYAQRDLLPLEARIHEAMDATDIERMLQHLDDEEERQRQDEADIADITAMLEMMSD